MKHFLALLTLSLVPSLTFAAFGDVSSTHANVDAVSYVQSNGIVNGYPDGTFRPDNQINRAELAKILVEANFDANVIAQCDIKALSFSDIPSDAWFAPYVCTAQANAIIEGYADGTFKPGQNVNFVESAKMISLSFGENDGTTGSTWFTPFVDTLSTRNAIPTTISNFEKNITRGEMAEMVYRLKAKVKNKTARTFQNNQLVLAAAPVIAAPVPSTPPAPVVDTPPVPATAGEYLDFDTIAWDAALGNKNIALFFHASWCPNCRKVDTEIKSRLLELPANSVVFKVDYDSEKDLKKKYGVTSQTTVVFLNADGSLKNKKTGFNVNDLIENL